MSEYLDMVRGMKYVAEQFVEHSAVDYENTSLIQSANTVHDYAYLVGIPVHEMRDDLHDFREQCAAQDRDIPVVWIYRKGQQELLGAMFGDPWRDVLNVDGTVWNRALSRLLLWLATDDQLYPVLQHLGKTLGSISTTERRMKLEDARLLMGSHVLLAFDRAVDHFEYHGDTPLQWQMPIIMHVFLAELYNTAEFHHVYTTLRTRHAM